MGVVSAFRFILGPEASRADSGRSAALDTLITAFRPTVREVTIEGSDHCLTAVLAQVPPATIIGRKALAHGGARVELRPREDTTWSTLATSWRHPVRIELRGARGRDRTLLVIADRGDTVEGFVDDPGILIAVEAQLQQWGSFQPKPAPRDEGGWYEKRSALLLSATSFGGPLGVLIAATEMGTVTAGMFLGAIATLALGNTLAWLIWRHAMRLHGGTWHGT